MRLPQTMLFAAAFAGITAFAAAPSFAQPSGLPHKPEDVTLTGTFKGEHGATKPRGYFHGTLNTGTDKVTFIITYSHLSGPVTAAHFHGPASPGQEAGVMLPIPGPYSSGMRNTLKADPATVKAMLAGKTYVNLHTAKYPNGEARAQVIPSKSSG